MNITTQDLPAITEAELTAARIVLDVSGKPGRRRYHITTHAGADFAHRRDFARKSDRDHAVRMELDRQERQRQAAAGPLDMAQVRAQESAKRALEIAAAGGHTIMLVGPEGCAKGMLRARMPSIGGRVEHVLTGSRADQPAAMYQRVSPTSGVDMVLPPPAERSEGIAARVAPARTVLATLPPRDLDYNATRLLLEAAERCPLTAEEVEAAKRVARTIAVLDNCTGVVRRIHIAEALCYRRPREG